MSEATALPTAPQPLPIKLSFLLWNRSPKISLFNKNGQTSASFLFVFVLLSNIVTKKCRIYRIRTQIITFESKHADHLTTNTTLPPSQKALLRLFGYLTLCLCWWKRSNKHPCTILSNNWHTSVLVNIYVQHNSVLSYLDWQLFLIDRRCWFLTSQTAGLGHSRKHVNCSVAEINSFIFPTNGHQLWIKKVLYNRPSCTYMGYTECERSLIHQLGNARFKSIQFPFLWQGSSFQTDFYYDIGR